MPAGRFAWVTRFALLSFSCLVASAPVRATPILADKGIYLAGPFPVPDITEPPSASAEAVFLAGSVAHAPLFLNELVIAGDGGQFSNNGWVGSSPFDINVVNGGRTVWISWDFSGTSYALTYVSVNFNNNFYHVYGTSPCFTSQGAVGVTGNQRDAISHIHFFGISRVPDTGVTGTMFLMALCALGFFRMRPRPSR